MSKILLVSSTQKGLESLALLMKNGGFSDISTAASSAETRRIVQRGLYDVIVVNTPLSDEFGSDLLLMLSANTSAGLVAVVKNDLADGIAAKVEKYGIMVIPKPISRQAFYQVLMLASSTAQRMQALRRENAKLTAKIEEIKLSCRAKCALMEQKGMTEAEAHRYIEKQAMDLRMAKTAVAEEIIDRYG